MKSKLKIIVCKFLFLIISCSSIISVISCSFFSANTQWLKSNNSNNANNTNSTDINYSSTIALKRQYETDLINIQTNWINNFQSNNPKWNNFNTNLSNQLNYELQQWNIINKTNNAKYLATLYPLLWSLNNALITLDWYFINYLLIAFISNLKVSQFSFLPTVSSSTSYINLLSKLNWIKILINPNWLIFKHDFKQFLLKQNISIQTWNDDLKAYCGSWMHNVNQEWTLSKTYRNIQIINLGFVSFNWLMMNEEVPSCFSQNNKTNLQVNNWNYFNNANNNSSLNTSNLKKQIAYYKQVQNEYDNSIKHLIFINSTN